MAITWKQWQKDLAKETPEGVINKVKPLLLQYLQEGEVNSIGYAMSMLPENFLKNEKSMVELLKPILVRSSDLELHGAIIKLFESLPSDFSDKSKKELACLTETFTNQEGAEETWPLICSVAGGLQNAYTVGSLEVLLDNGADIDAYVIPDKSTPLFLSSQNGHNVVVGFLAERGATVDWQDVEGITPIMQAARNGQIGVIRELLIRGGGLEFTSKDGRANVLHYAVGYSPIQALELLLNCDRVTSELIESTDRDKYSLLHMASTIGDLRKIDLLARKNFRDVRTTVKGKNAQSLFPLGHTNYDLAMKYFNELTRTGRPPSYLLDELVSKKMVTDTVHDGIKEVKETVQEHDDQLVSHSKSIKKLEHDVADNQTDIQQLRENQEHIEKRLDSMEKAFRDRLAEIESGSKEHYKKLSQELKELKSQSYVDELERERIKVLEKQVQQFCQIRKGIEELVNSKELETFVRQLQFFMTSTFTGLLALSSKEIREGTCGAAKIFGALINTIAPIPCAGNLVSAAISKVEKSNRQKAARAKMSWATSFAKMDEALEQACIGLAETYREPIEQLTEAGAAKLAEETGERIKSNWKKVQSQDISSDDFVGFFRKAVSIPKSQFIRKVTVQPELEVKKDLYKAGEKKRKHTPIGIFTEPGIKVYVPTKDDAEKVEVRFFGGPTRKSDKYGYIVGTMEQVVELELTEEAERKTLAFESIFASKAKPEQNNITMDAPRRRQSSEDLSGNESDQSFVSGSSVDVCKADAPKSEKAHSARVQRLRVA